MDHGHGRTGGRTRVLRRAPATAASRTAPGRRRGPPLSTDADEPRGCPRDRPTAPSTTGKQLVLDQVALRCRHPQRRLAFIRGRHGPCCPLAVAFPRRVLYLAHSVLSLAPASPARLALPPSPDAPERLTWAPAARPRPTAYGQPAPPAPAQARPRRFPGVTTQEAIHPASASLAGSDSVILPRGPSCQYPPVPHDMVAVHNSGPANGIPSNIVTDAILSLSLSLEQLYSVTGCGTDFLQWKWAEMDRAAGEVAA